MHTCTTGCSRNEHTGFPQLTQLSRNMPRCPPTLTHPHFSYTTFHTASLVSACALLGFLFGPFFSSCLLVRRAVALRSSAACRSLRSLRSLGAVAKLSTQPRAHPFVILSSTHPLIIVAFLLPIFVRGSPGGFSFVPRPPLFLVLLHLSCLVLSCPVRQVRAPLLQQVPLDSRDWISGTPMNHFLDTLGWFTFSCMAMACLGRSPHALLLPRSYFVNLLEDFCVLLFYFISCPLQSSAAPPL